MRSVKTALALAFALCATSAMAQSSVYIVGGIGAGKAKLNGTDFPTAGEAEGFLEEEAGLGAGALAGTVNRTIDDKDTTWNIAIGYRFNRTWAAELGYANLGEYNVRYSDTLGLGISDSMNYDVTALKLAGVGTFPVGQSFSLLGKLGLARTTAENSETFSGLGTGASQTFKKSKTRLFWGIGAQYDFSQKVGIRVEYEDYGKVGANFTDAGNEPGEAKISTINLNLVYSF